MSLALASSDPIRSAARSMSPHRFSPGRPRLTGRGIGLSQSKRAPGPSSAGAAAERICPRLLGGSLPRLCRDDQQQRHDRFCPVCRHRCPTSDLSHTDQPGTGLAECEASSTVRTITIRDAPFAKATAAVVKARNTSITATVPVARLAPSRRLWFEISITSETKPNLSNTESKNGPL
jgi:hypothetical protein